MDDLWGDYFDDNPEPCPFCGRSGVISIVDGSHKIKCESQTCPIFGEEFYLSDWNNRYSAASVRYDLLMEEYHKALSGESARLQLIIRMKLRLGEQSREMSRLRAAIEAAKARKK